MTPWKTAFLATLVGCSPNAVDSVVLDPRVARTTRSPESVAIVEARPAERHRIVALLAVDEKVRAGFQHATDVTTQVDLLRERAAALGCDALVVQRADLRRCVGLSTCVNATYYGHRGECIVFEKEGEP